MLAVKALSFAPWPGTIRTSFALPGGLSWATVLPGRRRFPSCSRQDGFSMGNAGTHRLAGSLLCVSRLGPWEDAHARFCNRFWPVTRALSGENFSTCKEHALPADGTLAWLRGAAFWRETASFAMAFSRLGSSCAVRKRPPARGHGPRRDAGVGWLIEAVGGPGSREATTRHLHG